MSYERKVKVVLHGHLKELYPHDIEMSGFSVAEILNGIGRQISVLRPKPGEDTRFFSVVGYDTHEALTGPIKPNQKELHIVPAMHGGKGGGFFKVVLGVALIAASFMMPAAGIAFSFGLSLALGGLLEILSPTPKIDRSGTSSVDPEASKYLGASQNTTKIGTRIPICYGEVQVFGHYISFDVDAKDVALK